MDTAELEVERKAWEVLVQIAWIEQRMAEIDAEHCSPKAEPAKRAAIAELTRELDTLKGKA